MRNDFNNTKKLNLIIRIWMLLPFRFHMYSISHGFNCKYVNTHDNKSVLEVICCVFSYLCTSSTYYAIILVLIIYYFGPLKELMLSKC